MKRYSSRTEREKFEAYRKRAQLCPGALPKYKRAATVSIPDRDIVGDILNIASTPGHVMYLICDAECELHACPEHMLRLVATW
jgi:hypothetical protein